MRRIKLWVATAVFGLSLTGTTFGQTKGDEVVVVVEKTDMKHEANTVQTISRGNYLFVREVNGNWLWVDSDGTRGWLRRDHVILASRAIDYFTTELRRNPRDARSVIARAIAWQRKGELTNAIRDCTDAIAIDSKWAWPYKIRGNAWKTKGEYDLAIADYEEGMRLDPKDNQFYVCRGRCHQAKKNYDKAIADFTEAIRLNPKSADNYADRGDSYKASKRYDNALADYTMAIELDPKAIAAYLSRATVYKDRKDFFRELADRKMVVEVAPENAIANNSVAWLLATCPDAVIRNGRRAVELATKAVELAKATRESFHNELDTLAAAHAEAGNFDEAVKLQQQAVALAPNDNKTDFESRLKLFQAGQPYRELPEADAVATSATK